MVLILLWAVSSLCTYLLGTGSRRRISDHEVFVFEPTYDDEWQHLESREESMKKLGQLLGPDFQRLTASTPPDAVTNPLPPLKTPAHRREVEVVSYPTGPGISCSVLISFSPGDPAQHEEARGYCRGDVSRAGPVLAGGFFPLPPGAQQLQSRRDTEEGRGVP